MLRGHREDWPVSLHLVREGIECLRAAGWPPSFIMMYDEAWRIMHAVSEVMAKGMTAAPVNRVVKLAALCARACPPG